MRARALQNTRSPKDLREVFFADNLYGVATLLWIGTGLLRAFGGWEKGSDYYLESTAFLTKMALFVVIFGLEIYPMVTLIRWRIRLARGEAFSLKPAMAMSKLTYAELALMTGMVFLAVLMARGMGYGIAGE